MQPDLLTDDPRVLVARLQQRNLHTQYVSEYFIPYRMMPDRMAEVRDQLQPTATTAVNRDFSPIAYYFNTVLWSAQFKPAYADWLRTAARLDFTLLLGAVLIVLFFVAAFLGFVPARARRVRSAAACAMGATGFTLMALQIFLLLAFQSIYGYVYHQLAILIASAWPASPWEVGWVCVACAATEVTHVARLHPRKFCSRFPLRR
jgi:spermidine synthase